MKKIIKIIMLLSFIIFTIGCGDRLNDNKTKSNNLSNEGIKYLKKGMYSKALEKFNEATKIYPKNDNAYLSLGYIYKKMGNYTKAINNYTKAIEINPEFSQAYLNRGYIYQEIEQFFLALNDYNKVIKLNNNQEAVARAYENRGKIYFVNFRNRYKGCLDYKKACDLGKCDNYDRANLFRFCN